MAAVYSGVWGVGEKALQIQEEDPPFSAISPVMPPQMIFKPAEGEVKAFPPLARPVVIDHAGAVEWNQNIVAKGFVDLPISDVWGVDGPHLAALPQSEMGTLLRLPRPIQHLPPTGGGAGKEVELEVLCTLLPADAVTAFLPVEEHRPVTESLFYGAYGEIAGPFVGLPLPLPVSVSRLAAILRVHKNCSTSVQMSCGVPSNLLRFLTLSGHT